MFSSVREFCCARDPLGLPGDPRVEQGEVVAELDAVLGRSGIGDARTESSGPELEVLGSEPNAAMSWLVLPEGPSEAFDLDLAGLLRELGEGSLSVR